jgi:hypothetical protein
MAAISSQLSIAMILLKVLFVTHFEWVFSLDPDRLAGRLLRLAVVVGLLPCAAIFVYESLTSSAPTSGIAYLAAQPHNVVETGLPPVVLYATAWSSLYALTLVFSLVFVPVYSRRTLLRSASLRAGEQKQNLEPEEWRAFASLNRVAVGCLIFVAVVTMTIYSNSVSSSDSGQVPPQVLFAPLLLNLTLLYCLTDHNVMAYMRRAVGRYRQMQHGCHAGPPKPNRIGSTCTKVRPVA